MAPSVKHALKAKKAASEYVETQESKPTEKDDLALRKKQNVEAVETKQARQKQAEGDRSGIKVGHKCWPRVQADESHCHPSSTSRYCT